MGTAKEKVVKWEGSLGIEQALSLKDELMKALESSKKVVLNLSAVEDIDSTTIQLIIAAQKEAEKRAVAFKVDTNIPAASGNFFALLNLPLINSAHSEKSEKE